MPRPTAQDSTDSLRGALRQLPDWFQTYEAKLREELGLKSVPIAYEKMP